MRERVIRVCAHARAHARVRAWDVGFATALAGGHSTTSSKGRCDALLLLACHRSSLTRVARRCALRAQTQPNYVRAYAMRAMLHLKRGDGTLSRLPLVLRARTFLDTALTAASTCISHRPWSVPMASVNRFLRHLWLRMLHPAHVRLTSRRRVNASGRAGGTAHGAARCGSHFATSPGALHPLWCTRHSSPVYQDMLGI